MIAIVNGSRFIFGFSHNFKRYEIQHERLDGKPPVTRHIAATTTCFIKPADCEDVPPVGTGIAKCSLADYDALVKKGKSPKPTGRVKALRRAVHNAFPCDPCSGKGTRFGVTCEACHGTGTENLALGAFFEAYNAREKRRIELGVIDAVAIPQL